MKKILYILLLSAVVCFTTIFTMHKYYSKKSEINISTPDYQLASEALYDEFADNKELATIKYQSKIVEVTGIVQEVYSKNGTQMKVILRAKDTYTGVSCIIEHKTEQIKEPLRLGDPITLQGLCAGISKDVVLMKCVIVKT